MENEKYNQKANEILTWLEHNDAGALGPVIEATLQAGLTATTDEDRDKFWASVRSLCGTLPKSPIRRGIQSSLTAEMSACVDSVVNRIESAFASIGEAELILDVMHPRQRGDSIGHYDSIESWAKAMAASGRRYMMEALNQGRWGGSMTDNLTKMALKEPKTTKEVSSDE